MYSLLRVIISYMVLISCHCGLVPSFTFLVGDIDYAFNSDICSFFTTTENKLFQNVLIPEMLYYAVKCMSVI